MLNKHKGMIKNPQNRFYSTLLILSFLNAIKKGTTALERYWIIENNNGIKWAGGSLKMSWPLTGNQDMCYVGEEVLILYIKFQQYTLFMKLCEHIELGWNVCCMLWSTLGV